jgi:hypothetical protein
VGTQLTDLTLVVVGADWPSLWGFSLEHINPLDLVMVANGRRNSMASIGNHYLDHARTPVVGLVHADCVFGAGALASLTDTAMGGAVCGIVGVNEGHEYRWAGINPGEVVTMDSSSVFLRADAGLRFDEKVFDGLHCHVEDICMQAHAAGRKVIVPAADCTHIGVSNNAPAWRAEYDPYQAKLFKKWGGPVIMT